MRSVFVNGSTHAGLFLYGRVEGSDGLFLAHGSLHLFSILYLSSMSQLILLDSVVHPLDKHTQSSTLVGMGKKKNVYRNI